MSTKQRKAFKRAGLQFAGRPKTGTPLQERQSFLRLSTRDRIVAILARDEGRIQTVLAAPEGEIA